MMAWAYSSMGPKSSMAGEIRAPTPYTYTTTLTAGTLSDIELHYYEQEGDAACRLQWSYPGQGNQIIPQTQLFP